MKEIVWEIERERINRKAEEDIETQEDRESLEKTKKDRERLGETDKDRERERKSDKDR